MEITPTDAWELEWIGRDSTITYHDRRFASPYEPATTKLRFVFG